MQEYLLDESEIRERAFTTAGIPLDRLAEICDAERSGRLVVLEKGEKDG